MKFKIGDNVKCINKVNDENTTMSYPKVNDIGIVVDVDKLDYDLTYKVKWINDINYKYNWWISERDIVIYNEELDVSPAIKSMHNIYKKMILVGFTEEQTMQLMIAIMSGGK